MAVAPAPGDAHPLLDALLEGQRNKLQGGTLSIVVIGEPGTGKSTLVNNILGREVAEVGHGLEPMTDGITSYESEGRDSTIKVYDTPNLCDHPMEEERRLADLTPLLRNDNIDVTVVICFKMIETRISPQSVQCLATYHRELRQQWDRVVFALTFADVVPHLWSVADYTRKLNELRAAIKDLLVGPEIGVARRVVNAVPILPVTKSCNMPLPDGYEWFEPFSNSILAVPRGTPGEDQPRQWPGWLRTLAYTGEALVVVAGIAVVVYAVWKRDGNSFGIPFGHNLRLYCLSTPDNSSVVGLYCGGVKSAVQNPFQVSLLFSGVVAACSIVFHKLSSFFN